MSYVGGEDTAFSDERAVWAGVWEEIYYDLKCVKVVIVMCGGFCLGLNDVICSIMMMLEDYGCEEILGIKYGFRGFFGDEVVDVNLLEVFMKFMSEMVEDI